MLMSILVTALKLFLRLKATRLILKSCQRLSGNAIKAGEVRLDIDAADCYTKPEVTVDSEDFKKKTEPIKKLTKATITLNIGPEKEVIDSSVSERFLKQTEDGTIEIDKDKVKKYMEAMEEKYETYGKPHDFKTTGGNVVSLSGSLGFPLRQRQKQKKSLRSLRPAKM